MRHTTDVAVLNPAQVREYIKTGGIFCPRCKSANIEGTEVEIDAGAAYQDMSCSDCNLKWTDGYSLDRVI